MYRLELVKNRIAVFQFDYFSEYSLNICLIRGSRYNYIVDTGMGSGTMIPLLKHMGEESKEIVVINTHFHWDHIWGNHVFQDSMIVAHRLCYEKIDSGWDGMLEVNKHYIDGAAVKCLPNTLFDSELYFPHDQIRLFYSPGHTVDGISILDEKEKVLIVGDNIGDTLAEPLPELDCDKENYAGVIKRYLELDFDTCISGHNQILSREFIKTIDQRLKG